MSAAPGPAGLDLTALARWLDQRHPGLRRGPMQAQLIVGGLSNLTYEVTDGHSRWALRRPPLGHVLPTAHDMGREFRIISALHGSPVPVASPVAWCEDDAVLGVPFYLMDFVDGVVLGRPGASAEVTPARAGRACTLLVDTLLALHDLDPDAVGLAEFGRPVGFLERQVRRWTTQWRSSVTRPRAEVDQLITGLSQRLPEQSRPGIVHGDYRLTNVIYSADLDRVAAVVDWELATLGDPLTDVGLLVAYQELSGQGAFVMPRLAEADGFASTADLVARYAAGTDRPLDRLPWYVAFAWFKLAVLAEGINTRHLQGQTVGAGFDAAGSWVPDLLDRGLRVLAADDAR